MKFDFNPVHIAEKLKPSNIVKTLKPSNIIKTLKKPSNIVKKLKPSNIKKNLNPANIADNIISKIFSFLHLPKTTDKISWKATFLYGLIPIIGQLIARIEYFKGSLDKSWLLINPLFIFPPFSLIPLILMKFDKIADGQGEKPYDIYIILSKIDLDGNKKIGIELLIQIFSIMIPFIIRYYNNCKKITFKEILNSSLWSIILSIFFILSPFIVNNGLDLLAHIPIVGIFIQIIKIIVNIPYLAGKTFGDDITGSLFLFFAYTIINMYLQKNINTYCN